MSDIAFSKSELFELGSGYPKKGNYCKKCKTYIPVFKDLDEQTKSRVLKLILNNQPMMAMQEIMAITGCSIRLAKIWVLHKGVPTISYPGPPCKYCGNPLITDAAKQCDHCFMDWHDENNPIKLK